MLSDIIQIIHVHTKNEDIPLYGFFSLLYYSVDLCFSILFSEVNCSSYVQPDPLLL